MEGKQVIAVAGTHGKTTTTSLIAYMLHRAGLSPTYMLGGECIDLGGNAAPGDGDYFVVEADEYDRAFLNYHPHIAVVTNIEPDHMDIYGTTRGAPGHISPASSLKLTTTVLSSPARTPLLCRPACRCGRLSFRIP